MKYNVLYSNKVSEFTNKAGMLMYKYEMGIEGVNLPVKINQKPQTPAPSGVMDLNITESSYGLEAKKAYDTPYQASTPSTPYIPQGNSIPPIGEAVKAQVGKIATRAEFRTPDQIMRSDALRMSIDHCIAKSKLLMDLNKSKDAVEELSGKHELDVAEHFYKKYIEYGITPITGEVTDEDVERAFEESDNGE